ncbi:hypothetical protein BC943DRAFT_327778 [Umbelopsis sp. AD052]|nr:hypothetical protein BC943DRAFT_327778 [Umbelopsis sp. AD052]
MALILSFSSSMGLSTLHLDNAFDREERFVDTTKYGSATRICMLSACDGLFFFPGRNVNKMCTCFTRRTLWSQYVRARPWQMFTLTVNSPFRHRNKKVQPVPPIS